ncbi:MAG: hypothetical protein ABW146_18945, partial [Candidatus Sedimenticola sp. 6PFRAG7]
NTIGAGLDTLTGISNLIGSRYNDKLTGDANDNIIYGGEGDDQLIGGGGNDVLGGGPGDNQFDWSNADTITLTDSGTLTINGDILAAGGINLFASKVVINSDVTLSTRAVADNSNLLDNPSNGNSGDIVINARNIEINDGAQLLAHAVNLGGTTFTAGDILVYAKNAPDIPLVDNIANLFGYTIGDVPEVFDLGLSILQFFNPFDMEIANVELTGATLKGHHVDIIANAGRSELFEDKKAKFSATSGVDVENDTIIFDTPHAFETGERVVYKQARDSDTGDLLGDPIGGLEDGGNYYVIVIDPMTIKLSSEWWATGLTAPFTTPPAVDLVASGAIKSHSLAGQASLIGGPLGGISDAYLGNALSTIGKLDFLGILKNFGLSLKFYDIIPFGISIAQSTISMQQGTINPTTSIDAFEVDINATALTGVDVVTRLLPWMVGVGVAVPTANVYLNDGVVINAADNIDLKSRAESTISVDVSSSPGILGLDAALLSSIIDRASFLDLNKYKKLPRIQIAVGVGVANTATTIAQGAVLDAGGDIGIAADTVKKQTVKAGAKADTFALAPAISYYKGNADVTVHGSVTADGNISLASQVKADGGDTTSASAKSGNDSWQKAKDWTKTAQPKKDADKLTVTVPVAVAIHDADSRTRIGGLKEYDASGSRITPTEEGAGAVLSESGNIEITATTTSKPTINSSSIIASVLTDTVNTSIGGDRKASAGWGGTFGLYMNSAEAYIGKDSDVDANGSLLIQSQTSTPWEQKWIDLDAFTGIYDDATNGSFDFSNILKITGSLGKKLDGYLGAKSGLFNTWAQSSGQATDFAIQGATNVLAIINNSNAYIDERAKVNQKLAYRSTDQHVSVAASSDVTTVNLSGVIPPGSFMYFSVLSGTRSGASGGGLNLLGNVYYNSVNAEIRSGAQVHGETLSVSAITDGLNVAIGAISGQSDKTSINATLSAVGMINSTKAVIDGDAVVTTGSSDIRDEDGKLLSDASLWVQALDSAMIIHAAGALAFGGTSAAGIAVAGNFIVRDTRAIIGKPDEGDSRSTGSVTSAGKIVVEAKNRGLLIGGVASATGSKPILGKIEDFSNKAGGAILKLPVISSIPLKKDIAKVFKEGIFDKGLNGLFPKKPEPETGETKPEPEKFTHEQQSQNDVAKFGLSISGSTAVNVLVDTAEAAVIRANINDATDLVIKSDSNTIVGSIAGSLAVSSKGESKKGSSGGGTEKKTVGIGVSIAFNSDIGQTRAFIEDSFINIGNDLTINASTLGIRAAVAASGGVGTQAEGGAGAISVAANVIVRSTTAYIQNSTVTAGNDISLTARNANINSAGAGSIAYSGGGTAIGPSVVGNVMVESITGHISDSTVTADGDISIKADNAGIVTSIAVSGALSKGGIAVPFSLAANSIVNETKAYISNTDPATTNKVKATSGSISITADDRTITTAAAGSLSIVTGGGGSGGSGGSGSGGSKTSFAGGASFTANVIVNTVQAYVLGNNTSQTLEAGGDIVLTANRGSIITGVAAAGAGGKTAVAIGGAASVNTIVFHTAAYLRDAMVNAEQDLLVTATDRGITTVLVLSGQLALDKEKTAVAVGGAAGVNVIVGTVESYIDNSQVNTLSSGASGRDVKLSATNESIITGIALGAQGALGDQGWAIGGSFAVNVIVTTNQSYI